ncbi:MAG: hypothetical protein JKX78_06685 [Alteromonadaceae bacterium]|nr:hypothetical protein [Alteromonadaceae bacterium]
MMIDNTLVNEDTEIPTHRVQTDDIKKTGMSFKQQLLILFVASVILLTLITSLITAYQTSKIVAKSTVNSGLQITNNFANQSLLALLTGSTDNAQDAVNSALGFNSVLSVAIVRGDNSVLLASSVPQKIQQYKSLVNHNLTDKTVLISEKNNVLIFAAPVILQQDIKDEELLDPNEEREQAQQLGYVLVEYSKQELHQIQRSIFINNVVIGVVISLILAFILRVLINRMTKPLSTLSQNMKSARNLVNYTKADVSGAAEIQQIALIYNQMMATLAEQNNELAKSRDTLESEVEIRTQELVVARDSALTASRHKSEFLANISHELRTPLQAIIGYTDLVREDLELECMDAQVEDLNKSIRSAHTLLALINNILDLAKIEAGRMDLNLKAVNIKNLVNETIETVLPMANANNNKLQTSFGYLSSTLMVDRQKLMQIFLNLLSNSCKFTKKGEITFTIHNDRHYLYFSVTDTGVGIEGDKLQYVFEQFTQVDGSQTRQFEGTGLGMAITQNFCDLMNGDLTVESEVGVGSTFSVKIPLIDD